MRLGVLIRLTVFLIVSLTIGIGSARWLIARSAATVPLGVGSWRIWSNENDAANGPYETAHYFLTGRLPPAAHQVRIYETAEDDDGAFLDGDCTYTVSGPAHGAHWWEVAIVDPLSGPLLQTGAHMSGTSSAQIVSNADGSFDVTIAREPKPGNWISPSGLARFSLAMSLRAAKPRDAIEPAAVLPRIARGECQ
jgi:hypothetical protein